MAGILADLSLRLSANTAELKNGLTEAKTALKDFSKDGQVAAQKITDSFKNISGTTSNIKEMRSALLSLRGISFVGKSKEEIEAVNKEIGRLTDEMKNLKVQQKNMGIEFGELMAKGMKAFMGIVEVGVGVATMFGASDEQAKKYQQTMTSMIGVMQGIGAIQEFMEQKLLGTMLMRIKDTVATIGQTIAQTALNVATGIGVSIMAVYLAGIVALVAVGYGLYKLYQYLTDTQNDEAIAQKAANAERKRTLELMDKVATKAEDSYISQEVHIRSLVKTINSETTSQLEKKKAMEELKALDPDYLKALDDKNIKTKEGIGLINNYITALKDKAYAEAASEGLVDALKAQNIAKRKLLDNKDSVKVFSIAGTVIVDDRSLKAAAKEVDNTTKDVEYYQKLVDTLKAPVVDYKTSGGNTGGKTKAESKKIEDEYNSWVHDEIIKNGEFQDKEIDQLSDKYIDADILRSESFIKGKNEELKAFQDTNKNKLENEKKFTEARDKAQQAFADRNKTRYQLDAKEYDRQLKAGEIDAKQHAIAIKEIEKSKNASNLGMIANTLSQAASLFKEHTIAYKVMASAEAAINTYLSATLAYKAGLEAGGPLGLVLGPIMAGVAIAAGLANIAKINGINFAHGGIVPGSNYSGDNVPIRANSGEMILNGTQQAKLFSMINFGSTNQARIGEVEFEIKGDRLVGVLNNYGKKINNTR